MLILILEQCQRKIFGGSGPKVGLHSEHWQSNVIKCQPPSNLLTGHPSAVISHQSFEFYNNIGQFFNNPTNQSFTQNNRGHPKLHSFACHSLYQGCMNTQVLTPKH